MLQKNTKPDQSYFYIMYEESLVSSNLSSKLFRFHSAHPYKYMVEGHLNSGLFNHELFNPGLFKHEPLFLKFVKKPNEFTFNIFYLHIKTKSFHFGNLLLGFL